MTKNGQFGRDHKLKPDIIFIDVDKAIERWILCLCILFEVVKHLKTCIQNQFPGIKSQTFGDVKKWVDMKVYIVKLLWEKIGLCAKGQTSYQSFQPQVF